MSELNKESRKIRNLVPIAVTPEGFWCCPSPVVFQKTVKSPVPLNKTKPPPPPSSSSPTHSNAYGHKKPTRELNKMVSCTDHKTNVGLGSDGLVSGDKVVKTPKAESEHLPRKVCIEFGEGGSSDMKVVLVGKHGFVVKLIVHRSVLVENSCFFADKLADKEVGLSSIQIDDCEDVEIYVETVGLMYCKDKKQRLIKQSVQRVLRVLKVAEAIGFNSCIRACLDYLEAVPWVGEEEEEKVVSSVLRLQSESVGVNPILKRVSSKISKPPRDTLSHIIDLVLKSNEERGRREMKSIVLKLLRENNNRSDSDNNPSDICYETIYMSCRCCLDSLLAHFRQAAEPDNSGKAIDCKDPLAKLIALESDNLVWLLEILAERQAADEFALMWSNQQELACLHPRLPIMIRYHASWITSRLFVGIGRGELLPSKDIRHMLLQTWFEPLINDYGWLNHACRSFDRTVVEEGIGRTILTLPLEDQQSILLSWVGKFLKSGDNCPNLQRAFEVWWRRTFIRPYSEPRADQDQGQSDNSVT